MERQRYIIVVCGLQSMPNDRWKHFLTALHQELEASGLGQILEHVWLKHEDERGGSLGPQEVAVALKNADYGWALVDRVISEVGLQPRCPVMPERWRAFNCEDYFASDLAESGYHDRDGQYQPVFPRDRIYEDDELELLVIGSPGCDGIAWGYRRGMAGVWAWYPIAAEFEYLAPGLRELLEGWLTGTIHA